MSILLSKTSPCRRLVGGTRCLLLTGVLVALLWGLPRATAQSAPAGPRRTGESVDSSPADASDDGRHAEHDGGRTALRTIREDSLLRRSAEGGEPLPDLRSRAERARDAEFFKHYTRMAQLDVIAALARRARDADLADRAAQVRRREVRRFMTAMQRFLVETRQGVIVAPLEEGGALEESP